MSAGITFIDQRLGDIFRYPLAWGSLQSIELQVLLLVECKASMILEEADPAPLEWIHRLLVSHKEHAFPQAQSLPLHAVVEDVEQLVAILRKFVVAADIRIKLASLKQQPNPHVAAPESLGLWDTDHAYPRSHEEAH